MTLETYQKLDILNDRLRKLNGRGRPPTWYKNIVESLYHPQPNIPLMCLYGEPIFYFADDIYNLINDSWNADVVNTIYHLAGLD